MSNHRLIATTICLLLFGAATLNAQSPDPIRNMREINPSLPPPIKLDESKIKANSISILPSKHLLLLTDLPSSKDVREFNEVFDQAIPQWCQYFNVDPSRTADWQLRGMIMGDKQKFIGAGLMQGIPEFPAGFQTGHEMWVYLQPGTYYTRHLLIHEGTHAFMQWFLGGTGAPWYTEGMAELLGIHQWRDNRLAINFQLSDRSQAPYWGRIKLLQEDVVNGKAMTLNDVFAFSNSAFRDVRSYAWSWAACQFLSQHELARDAFENLKADVRLSPTAFNQSLTNAIATVRTQLDIHWSLFIHEIDFGYDINRGRLKSIRADASGIFELAIDQSWQQTNFAVERGEEIRVFHQGQFIIGIEDGTPLRCEANGITLNYYDGKPQGQLVFAVRDKNDVSDLNEANSLGSSGVITCNRSGFLCFRVNESPAYLGDNSGNLKLKMVRRR